MLSRRKIHRLRQMSRRRQQLEANGEKDEEEDDIINLLPEMLDQWETDRKRARILRIDEKSVIRSSDKKDKKDDDNGKADNQEDYEEPLESLLRTGTEVAPLSNIAVINLLLWLCAWSVFCLYLAHVFCPFYSLHLTNTHHKCMEIFCFIYPFSF